MTYQVLRPMSAFTIIPESPEKSIEVVIYADTGLVKIFHDDNQVVFEKVNAAGYQYRTTPAIWSASVKELEVIHLSEESFDMIQQLIAEPPALKPDLVNLMERTKSGTFEVELNPIFTQKAVFARLDELTGGSVSLNIYGDGGAELLCPDKKIIVYFTEEGDTWNPEDSFNKNLQRCFAFIMDDRFGPWIQKIMEDDARNVAASYIPYRQID